jgi:hypothetical protein
MKLVHTYRRPCFGGVVEFCGHPKRQSCTAGSKMNSLRETKNDFICSINFRFLNKKRKFSKLF